METLICVNTFKAKISDTYTFEQSWFIAGCQKGECPPWETVGRFRKRLFPVFSYYQYSSYEHLYINHCSDIRFHFSRSRMAGSYGRGRLHLFFSHTYFAYVPGTVFLFPAQAAIKPNRRTEQTSGLCGRRRGRDVQREQHWNKYTIKGETDHQPRLDAWDKCSGLVHWEDPEGWDGEGGRRGDRDGEHM